MSTHQPGIQIRPYVVAMLGLCALIFACNEEDKDPPIADLGNYDIDTNNTNSNSDGTLGGIPSGGVSSGDGDADTEDEEDSDEFGDTGLDTEGIDTESENWTLMFYMDGDNNLEEYILGDLMDIVEVDVPEWLTILVLFDRHPAYDISDDNWVGTRLFRVKDNQLERLSDADYLNLTDVGDYEELDMGAAETLEGFINFAQNKYPADYYGLFFSDHGDGWQKKRGDQFQNAIARNICADETNGGILSVQTDIRTVVQDKDIDVIGFDACLMGMVEVAWAFKDHVRYMVASEENEPGEGWAYTEWLTSWIEEGGSVVGLAKSQVQSYKEYYEQFLFPWTLTQSAIDLAKMDELGDAIDDFVLNYNPEHFVQSAVFFGDGLFYYYDLWDVANGAGDLALQEAVEDAVIYNWNSNGLVPPAGLSIYYVSSFENDYRAIPFCQDTNWC